MSRKFLSGESLIFKIIEVNRRLNLHFLIANLFPEDFVSTGEGPGRAWQCAWAQSPSHNAGQTFSAIHGGRLKVPFDLNHEYVSIKGNIDGGAEDKQHSANRPGPRSHKVATKTIVYTCLSYHFRDLSVSGMILPKNTLVFPLFAEILKVAMIFWNYLAKWTFIAMNWQLRYCSVM